MTSPSEPEPLSAEELYEIREWCERNDGIRSSDVLRLIATLNSLRLRAERAERALKDINEEAADAIAEADDLGETETYCYGNLIHISRILAGLEKP